MNEMKSNKSFQDKLLNDLNKTKMKLDLSITSMQEMRKFNEKYISEYCDKIVEHSEAGVKSRNIQFEIDLNNIRVENGKYHLQAMKNVNDLKEELEKFHMTKEAITKELKNEKSLFIETHNDIYEQFKVKKCFCNLQEVEKKIQLLDSKFSLEILKLNRRNGKYTKSFKKFNEFSIDKNLNKFNEFKFKMDKKSKEIVQTRSLMNTLISNSGEVDIEEFSNKVGILR